MDSDDSYETTPDLLYEIEIETEYSSTSSQSGRCVVSDHIVDNREYDSCTPDNPTTDETGSPSYVALALQIQVQNDQLHQLKTDRISLLEEITKLYATLEEKENELMEFVHSYEQKVNDVANYMQEVQNLLVELCALFPAKLDGPIFHSSDTNGFSIPKSNGEDSRRNSTTTTTTWDNRGRALLQALSASVASASARNKQDTLPRCTSTVNATATIPKDEYSNGQLAVIPLTDSVSTGGYHLTPEGKVNDPILGVLPSFCWTPEQTVHWLTEYAHLPGGCLDAAKRAMVNGQQLMMLSDTKVEKVLHLNDAGLRRKFKLALEDLRVHGVPGLSRTPGPSHLHPNWICSVWLRRYIGLIHLIPLFATRRIDGRLLASLAVYKTHERTSNPYPQPSSHINQQPDAVSTIFPNEFHGVNQKELHRILFGIGRDGSASSGGYGLSGAELPSTVKFFLGKREAFSLSTGVELLRTYNFNIQALEVAQEERKNDLMLWTNERLSNWLDSIGLQDFTHGIAGTGLHGAYIVLDPTFNTGRLMKILHIPSTTAADCRLEEQLESILKPARVCQGIVRKQFKFFRRRSISRSQRQTTMQRSITTSSTAPDHKTSSSSCLSNSSSSFQNGSVVSVNSKHQSDGSSRLSFTLANRHTTTPSIQSSPFQATTPSSSIRISKKDKRKGLTVDGFLGLKDLFPYNFKNHDSQSASVESVCPDEIDATANDEKTSTLIRQNRSDVSQKSTGLVLVNDKGISISNVGKNGAMTTRAGLKTIVFPL